MDQFLSVTSERADRLLRLTADLVIGCLVFYGFR